MNTLISFQKSGRTWLMAQVARYVQDYYGLSAEQAPNSEGWCKADSRIPSVRVLHDEDAYLKDSGALSSDKRAFKDDAVVFIMRDPRDVIVSFYFELSRRTKFYRQWGYDTSNYPTAETPIGEFLRRQHGGFAMLLEYYRIWDLARRDVERFIHVRYEDLHAAPEETLAQVLTHWRFPIDRDLIRAAIDACRFERMRRIEAKSNAPTLAMRPADPNDPESFKVRRGTVGGYHEYLSAEDIAYMNELCADLPPLVAVYRTPRR